MKPVAAIIWFGLGLIGFAGQNALYQAGVHSYWDKGCWVEEMEWRYTKHELMDVLPAVTGPIYLVVSFALSGGFSQGLSFHFGVPKRCERYVMTPEELKQWNERAAHGMSQSYDYSPRVK